MKAGNRMAGKMHRPGDGRGRAAWIGVLAGLAAWFAGGAAGEDGHARLEMRGGAPVVVFESGTDSYHRVFAAGYLEGAGNWRLTNVLGGVEGWQSWTDAAPARLGFYAVERWGWEALVDSDGDGMPDGWELRHRLRVMDASDVDEDADGDELTNLAEFRAGTDPRAVDSDGDGFSDGWEVANGFDPLDAGDVAGDPDQDGLSNSEEAALGTDPLKADTDGDGMPDGWEVANGLNPLENDAERDADQDGLSNLVEYGAGTKPQLSDSDGDGMPDGWEVANGLNPLENDAEGDADQDGLSNLAEYGAGTKPQKADSDGDGMLDGWEVANGLNPLENDAEGDADQDGLSNLAEYGAGTKPQLADSDGDGMPDGWEVANGLNPLENDAEGDADQDGLSNLAEFGAGTKPQNPDSDGDGFSDGWEVANGFNPLDAGDVAGDADQDGLSNSEEAALGTDPLNPDSDGDGLPDGWEVANGFNPLDEADGAADPDGDGLSNAEEYRCGTNMNAADSDNDGMPDGWEVANGLNPLKDDTAGDLDEDGLSNGEELALGTNPQMADSDGDGMPDGWEIANGLNPLADDAGGDADGEGLSNGEEYALGTNPQAVDSDNDGLPDNWEAANGFNPTDASDGVADPDGDGLTNAEEYVLNTKWDSPDSDGDGMPDGWEAANGLDPLDWMDAAKDTDQDGLSNLAEYGAGTNPQAADTDGDGMPDGWEVENGLNPLEGTDGAADPDGDGLSNAEEYAAGTNPRMDDCDGDGLPDGAELVAGTDPWIADTDSDGLPDGWEVANGLNPVSDGGVNYGLVAHWTFDEGRGGVVSNRAGAKWHGALKGMTSANWDEGRGGGALRFNGLQQYVSVLETEGEGNVLDGGPFTVTWVCKHEPDGAPIHAALGGEMPSAKGWRVRFEGEGTALHWCIGNGTMVKSAPLAHAAELSDWTDVAVTWDGTNAWGYVNGAEAGGTRIVTFADAAAGELLIGACQLNLDKSYWKGWIDDMRVYRRSLSAEDLGAVNDWLGDADGDGVRNGREYELQMNPQAADSDNDGLDDGDELALGTNPLVPDSDGDGMPDGWEVQNRLDPLGDDAGEDADGDGEANVAEYGAGTNPWVADTDGDGLGDAWEMENGLNPLSVDSDGDGMPDGWEVENGLDPRVSDGDGDADGDGLPNGMEQGLGTNPRVADTDGDGLDDGQEFEMGTNPLRADSDGDGLPDGWEAANGLDPLSDGGKAHGLVAWWKMDGDLENAAGPSWPGSLLGKGGTNWEAGRGAGGALWLGGTNQYVSVAEDMDGPVLDGGPFTVTWVCKFDQEGAPALAALGGKMPGTKGWRVRFEGNGAQMYWSIGDGSTLKSAPLASAADLSDWTDVAVTWDGTNAWGYVNGRELPGGKRVVGFADAPAKELLIGACQLNKDKSYWKGWIDDVRIYRKSLSAVELGEVNDWLGDADGDGLTNGREYGLGTDPQSADSDGDGLPDGEEMQWTTNPLVADSDGDGMPDGWEVANGLNPLRDDAADDMDGDGVPNVAEHAAGTNPWVADTDLDGLGDGWELENGLNPLKADSDGDAMPDGWEAANGLNPLADDAEEDPDGDGLANLEEYGLGTNPQAADTDDDGLDDGSEVADGLNPLAADSDGDGLPDGWEAAHGLNPLSDGGVQYGLAAWWKMDGDLLNAAGPSWPGRMRGPEGMTWERGRGAGRALRFSGDRRYVSVAETNFAGAVLDGGPFTVTWVCKYDAEGAPALAALGGEMPSAKKGWRMRFEGENKPLGWCVGDGQTAKSASLATAEELSEWTDVALTWDGTNAWGYLNGRELAGGKRLVEFMDAAAGELLIGACQLNLDKSYWKGWIDDVRVFRRSLSEEDLGAVNDWLGDADGDGLTNGREYELGTDPQAVDSDNDGLGDAAEVALGTNPLATDSDGDGMPDGWEVENGLNPLKKDAAADADGDGLSNGEEQAAGTNPWVADTDEDGLGDGWELENGLNPLAVDSDGDGMPDGWEVSNQLDPLSDDSAEDPDGDGLPNLAEYGLGTDPRAEDTDGDGLMDGDEVEITTNPLRADSDGDGLPDQWEVANGLNPISDGGVQYGLVAWWKMDGDLTNAAGPSWPGRMRGPGGTVWDAGRGAGEALRLNGERQYVGISETNGAGSVLDGGPFTVTWVCKYDPDGAPIHAALGGEMPSTKGWRVRFEGAGSSLTWCVGNGQTKSAPLANATELSEWTDVALTWDGTNAWGYVNGVELPGGKRIVGFADAAAGELLIGACQLNLDKSYWKGWIDDVRVYRRSLSAAELGKVNDWLGDADGDGLSNGREYELQTNPQVADTDEDGLPDGQEVALGTNPQLADTDGDGLPDGWEVGNGLNPLEDDAGNDADGDGLSNRAELEAGTNPQKPDSDEDGLGDGWEVANGLDPLSVDSDKDGLPDGWEEANGLNPLADDAADDPDGDGLPNTAEYGLGTNPHAEDTDGDGLTDGVEVEKGTDPLRADSDGDGLPDGWEAANGLNPLSDGGVQYGLAAWWKMDGDLENAAGPAWPGRMRGPGAVVWTEGRGAGGALRLSGDRQYVGVSETNGAGSVLDGGPFTVTWVCKYDTEGAPTHAALGGEMPSTKGWRVRFEGAGTALTWCVGDGQTQKSAPLANAADLSEWTDVAVTWDGTNAWGYINGVELQGGKRVVGFADAAAGELLIGACQLNLDKSYWKGWIDDVRVFRRSLSAEELGAINDWLGDADGDGLPNGREYELGTNPQVADSDNDGLGDADEVAFGTNPLATDSDGDGMPDGWEVLNGLEPLEDDAAGDLDGDGLPNRAEMDAGTNPRNPDSDGDGLEDGWEADNGLNPLLTDSDGDGMPDGWEVANQLNPHTDDAADDPDADGLTNGTEYGLGTNPRAEDSDGDGLKDGFEVEMGTDPLRADSDGDGLPDGWEFSNGLNPLSDGGVQYGLAAWWRMDGDLENAAGPEWMGRMRGPGEAVWEAGRGAGGALRFSGDRQYVGVPVTDGAGSVLDGGPFTLTWVCKCDTEGELPAHAALGGEMPSSKGWRVRFEGAGTALSWCVGDGQTQKSAPLADEELLSEWTDVAVTWDGTNAWGYVNGVDLPGGKRLVQFKDAGVGELLIGACQLNMDKSYWKGWIDDVRVYRRSLSAVELGEVNDWLGDADGDGLPNGREYELETDPQAADTDNDGLGDAEEVALGTNPHVADTDGDGMPDGWEVENGLNPQVDDADGDADGDGLSNGAEYRQGTDPQLADSDEDGVWDGAEVDAGMNPLSQDSDEDGLPDGWEVANGLNPLEDDAAGDADGDGLSNATEYGLGTAANLPDTDGDGLEDRQEHDTYGTNPLLADTDADGLGDAWEVANRTDPLSGMHADLKPLLWLTFDEGRPGDASFIANRAKGRYSARLVGVTNAVRVEGIRGGALWLDGESTYLTVPQSAGRLLGTNGYTVSLWIRAEKGSNEFPTVFSDISWASNQGRGVAVREVSSENTLQLVEGFPDALPSRVAQLWGERWRGEWTHLAVVHDGKALRMYLNGSLYGELPGAAAATGNPTLLLGRGHLNADNSQSHWKGAMDDVRVFGRALSREEIASLVEAETDGDLTGMNNLAKAEAGIGLEPGAVADTEGSLDMLVRLGEGTPEGLHWLARYDGANPGSEAEVFLNGDDLYFELHDGEGRPHGIRISGVTSNGFLTAGTNRVTASWRGFDGTAHGADLRLFLNGVDVIADGIWRKGSSTPKLTVNARALGEGYQEGAWTEGSWGERDGSGRAWFGRRHERDVAETGAVEVVEWEWHRDAYGIPDRPEVPGGEAEEKSVYAMQAEGKDPRVLVQDMMRPGVPEDFVDHSHIDVLVKRYRQFTDSVEYAPRWMRGEPAVYWPIERESLELVLENGEANGVGIAMSGHTWWKQMVCLSNRTAKAGEFIRITTNGTDLVLSLERTTLAQGSLTSMLVDRADRRELEKFQDQWGRALSEYQGYANYFMNETALTGIDETPWDAATFSAAGLEWFREYTVRKYGASYAGIKFPLPALPSMLTPDWEGMEIRVEGELAERAEATRDPDIWAKWWEWREVVFATEIGGYASRLAALNAANTNWQGTVLFVSPALAFTRRSGLNMEQLAKVKGLDWIVMENTRLYQYGSEDADLEEEIRLQLEAAKTATGRGGAGFGSYAMVHAYPYPDVVDGVTNAHFNANWLRNDMDWAVDGGFQSKIVVPYSAVMLMDRPQGTATNWQNTHYLPEAEDLWLNLRYTKLRSPPAGLSAERLTTQFLLSWLPVDGAEEYEVQVARDEDFTDIVANMSATGGSVVARVDAAGLPEQVFWRVRAVYMKRSYTDEGEETGSRRYYGNWSAGSFGTGTNGGTR